MKHPLAEVRIRNGMVHPRRWRDNHRPENTHTGKVRATTLTGAPSMSPLRQG